MENGMAHGIIVINGLSTMRRGVKLMDLVASIQPSRQRQPERRHLKDGRKGNEN